MNASSQRAKKVLFSIFLLLKWVGCWLVFLSVREVKKIVFVVVVVEEEAKDIERERDSDEWKKSITVKIAIGLLQNEYGKAKNKKIVQPIVKKVIIYCNLF